MAKLIALEWDEVESRVVVGSAKGAHVSVDRAHVIPLSSQDRDGTRETPAETLARALSEAKIPKGDAIVNVGRSGTELRMLEVPNVPEAELPAIVRFQALRQFATMTDEWSLDFIRMSDSEKDGEQIKVLAAAISPQLVKQLREGCERSGLTVKRLLFRPFSVASLFAQGMPSEKTRLIVDFTSGEADLIALSPAGIRLARTVRLPGAQNGTEQTIAIDHVLPELRRTIMTYGNQPGADSIEQVILCGGEKDLSLAEALKEKLSLEVTVVDPFQLVEVSSKVSSHVGEGRHHFAGLVGALMTPEPCNSSSIDFLNPRKPPVENANQQKQIVFGVIAGIAILLILGFGYFMLSSRQSRIDELVAQANSQRNNHQRTVGKIQQYKEVETFLDGAELNWADEIDRVSAKLPQEGVLVKSMSFQIDQGENLGVMRYNAMAVNDDKISEVEEQFRDERHSVTPMSNQESEGEYMFSFSGIVTIEPKERDAKPKSAKAKKSETADTVSNESTVDGDPLAKGQASQEMGAEDEKTIDEPTESVSDDDDENTDDENDEAENDEAENDEADTASDLANPEDES